MTEDVDFRSIDKLLYFVLSLLSLKLKEKGVSLGKFPEYVSPTIKMHALQHSLSCKVWNNIKKDAQTACATRCKLIFVYNC